MKMRMLLLVSAVALLVSPAVVSPAVVSPRNIEVSDVNRLKLNAIYEQAEKCRGSLTEDIFVENVSHLTQGRDKCGDKFFCKVQKILLNKHEDFCESTDKTALVRTLQAYNRGRNCEGTLQGVTTSVEVQVSKLLGHVKHCVQHRNFHGTYKK